MRRRATISDIAKQAGVSVGTVSNVFNNRGRFTTNTREKVMLAASELHFTPNALIRSLQSGKTNTIGVYTWQVKIDIANDISMYLLRGITTGLTTARLDTLLYSCNAGLNTPTPPTMFLDGRVDGLILAPGGLSTDVFPVLAKSHLPTVALYQTDLPAEFGSVNIDNLIGIEAAVDHLVALGHRRIAFYAPLSSFDFKERTRGYHLALEKHSLPFDPTLHIIPSAMYREEVPAACDYLMGLPEPPTALLAGDDSAALVFLQTFAQRGLHVPEDISVIGFDDAPAANIQTGLTTVRQPAVEVGQIAARFVHALIHGASAEDCRVTLPVELVVRGTTAIPLRNEIRHPVC